MQSHLKLFTQFCHDLGHQPFPVQVTTILRYLAFLSASGRAFGIIQNHIYSIKHFHLLLGFAPGWDSAHLFQLALRGSKRLLGTAPLRKLPITPNLLLSMARLFNLGNPLHAAMWALFLVAFFSFLRQSNLVAASPSATSDKLPRRCDLVLAPEGAFLQIRATKTSSNQWLGSAGARLLRDARHKRHRSLHGSTCRMDSNATKARSTLRRVAEQLLILYLQMKASKVIIFF